MPAERDVADLLGQADDGMQAPADELMSLVYDEVRALAGSLMARRPIGSTLEPTAIVHEAFLKLVASPSRSWKNRAHFLAVASKALRQVLADYARRKKSQKRGGQLRRIALTGVLEAPRDSDVDLVVLDDALSRLAELDARQARVVELRFLAGLEVEETAELLGISVRTAEREWFAAKAWLRRELSPGG